MKTYYWAIASAIAICLAATANAQNLAIAAHISSLGIGGDVAFKLSEPVNLRGSVNFFQYDHVFTRDGIRYDGPLNFRSVETIVDWFPFRNGFHLSPGLVLYNGNEADLNAAVPAGQTFTLGGTTYTSSPSTGLVNGAGPGSGAPITGHGSIVFQKVAPEIRIGWGNLIPTYRRISIPVELGAVFQGAPTASLDLQGAACDPTGRICVDASNPIIQSSIQAEVAKINHSISDFKVYPVFSIGVGYRF